MRVFMVRALCKQPHTFKVPRQLSRSRSFNENTFFLPMYVHIYQRCYVEGGCTALWLQNVSAQGSLVDSKRTLSLSRSLTYTFSLSLSLSLALSLFLYSSTTLSDCVISARRGLPRESRESVGPRRERTRDRPPTVQWETFLIIFHSGRLSYKPRYTKLSRTIVRFITTANLMNLISYFTGLK